MKKRVLFIDDESNILDGIRRALRGQRREWDMVFACGPEEGLEAFREEPFDIVVSDMRMPGMDGADFLTKIMHSYPGTIRIILSGHADPAAIMKSVGVTHQYLSKPCDPETLRTTIERAVRLKELVESDTLRDVVSGLDSLPPVPRAYRELVTCLQSDNADTASVAKIISSDIAMSTRVLQLVNSAFFGLAKTVSSIDRAVTYLGLDTIGSLVLAQGAFQMGDELDVPGFDANELARFGLRTATYAKAIAEAESLAPAARDQVFLASMLQDVGKLVLAVSATKQFTDYIGRAQSEGESEQLEVELLGAPHSHVGAYLLGLWGLPNPIVESVAYHEMPSSAGVDDWAPFGIVHVAARLAENAAADPLDPAARVDIGYLTRAGALDRWPRWQAAIKQLGRGEQE